MAIRTHKQMELPLMVEDRTQPERESRGCTIVEAVATASAIGGGEGCRSCRVTAVEHSSPDLNEAA